ncbi:MAG: alanine racemase [Methyloligellaceae bacterium]
MPPPEPDRAWMLLDLDAVEANFHEVRRRVGAAVRIIASVKANAYGHGVGPVARRLEFAGVDMFATGSVDEAIALRKSEIETPVLMFGAALPSAVPELIRQGLIPTVHNAELAEVVAICGPRPNPVFVKVDCGLGRLGVPLCAAHRFVLDLARQPLVEVAGLYTHLPFYDAAGMSWARERIARFDDLVAALARDGLTIPTTQARASAAIVTGIGDNCSAVCPGGILYGHSPVEEGLGDASGFRPVMAGAGTRLIQVSPKAGEGARGVVPFGRCDGNRAAVAGETAHMLVRGVKAPVLAVSLEHAVLDLSAVDNPKVGDEAVILGGSGPDAITLARLAQWWGVGVNDVLMAFNRRMAHRYLPTNLC